MIFMKEKIWREKYLKYIPTSILACIFVYIQVMADLMLPDYLAKIVNEGIMGKNIDLIWESGRTMLLITLVSVLSTILISYLAALISSGVARDVRGDIFQRVESYSLREFDKFSTASLITRNTNDVTQLTMLIFMTLRVAVSAPIMAIGGITKAVEKSSDLSWILVVAIPLALIFAVVIIAFLTPKFNIVQKLVDKLNMVSRQSLNGVRVIRAFRNEKVEEERFEKVNFEIKKLNMFLFGYLVLINPIIFFIMNMTQLAIVWFGADALATGAIQPNEVGNIIAFINYSMQVFFAFMMISMIAIQVPRSLVSWKRIKDILSTYSSVEDKENSVKTDENNKVSLLFDKVSFSYPGAQEKVLHNISFSANAGETLAIIGSTGSGKSTLVNLIPRFYDVCDGKIEINGTDIRDYSQADLHDKIGYVSQKAVLFSGTIASNIKLGKLDASDEEMEKVAKIAQAEEFILEKEDKFNSEITQGGTNVSGGQKQRISIARALIRYAPIYIFDDSFSALDFKTDRALRKGLSEHTTNSITIIVAQRVTSIMDADQILVLDNGKIVGKGTHKQLLVGCEVYKEIASSQLSKEELENA